MKDNKSKKTMKENYNAVHNLCEQYAGLNALRDIFSEAQKAEKIIDTLDKDVNHLEEIIKHLEIAKGKLKDEIATEYKKFKEKQKSGYDAVDKAWLEHNARVKKDSEDKLGILETEVEKMMSDAGKIKGIYETRKIVLKKLEDRITLRESQLKSIDDQINKLKEAIA